MVCVSRYCLRRESLTHFWMFFSDPRKDNRLSVLLSNRELYGILLGYGKPPANSSLALSLLSSNEGSIAGTGAAVAGAAAAAAAAGFTAAEGVPAAGDGGHQSGRKPSDWAVGGAELCLLCTSEFVGLCSAEAAHPSRRENK